MAKGNILQDSFEQLAELGQSTVKQGAKQIGQTFSPLKLFDQLTGKSSDITASVQEERSDGKTESVKKSNTPLNFDRLTQKYKDQDTMKMESLRSRLFQIVKRDEEKLLEQKKAKEQQKKQKEDYEKEQKNRQRIKHQQEQQMQEIPQGKKRRSIFSHKKVVQRAQAEVKPATGKQ